MIRLFQVMVWCRRCCFRCRDHYVFCLLRPPHLLCNCHGTRLIEPLVPLFLRFLFCLLAVPHALQLPLLRLGYVERTPSRLCILGIPWLGIACASFMIISHRTLWDSHHTIT